MLMAYTHFSVLDHHVCSCHPEPWYHAVVSTGVCVQYSITAAADMSLSGLAALSISSSQMMFTVH